MVHKKLKGKWVVLYVIELSNLYGIDEGVVATYGFVSTTNHARQTIRKRRKGFFTERGKSIQNPRFFFNGNYNMKIGKSLYSYK